MRKILKDSVYIVIGSFLLSLAVNLFLLPNKITVGGVTGVGTILYYLFNINVSITNILLNIPLFIYAMYKKGIVFSIKSITTTVLVSIFLDITIYQNFIIDNNLDLIISAIYGGIILGLGVSFIFKAESTSGGSDLLADLLKDKIKINVSQILFIIDLIVVVSLIIVFKDVNIGLYSIIAIFISTKVIDIMFEGINKTKVINIITKNSDLIPKEIIDKVHRSATITKVIGAYTKEKYIQITCIVTLNEINKVKQIVNKYDKNSIIYITNSYQTIGKGFIKLE